jgi:hypothetical protein
MTKNRKNKRLAARKLKKLLNKNNKTNHKTSHKTNHKTSHKTNHKTNHKTSNKINNNNINNDNDKIINDNVNNFVKEYINMNLEKYNKYLGLVMIFINILQYFILSLIYYCVSNFIIRSLVIINFILCLMNAIIYPKINDCNTKTFNYYIKLIVNYGILLLSSYKYHDYFSFILTIVILFKNIYQKYTNNNDNNDNNHYSTIYCMIYNIFGNIVYSMVLLYDLWNYVSTNIINY